MCVDRAGAPNENKGTITGGVDFSRDNVSLDIYKIIIMYKKTHCTKTKHTIHEDKLEEDKLEEDKLEEDKLKEDKLS